MELGFKELKLDCRWSESVRQTYIEVLGQGGQGVRMCLGLGV